jgi:hypothetical protein
MFCRTPLDDGSTPSKRSVPDNTQHSQQTAMPTAWFEPAIPTYERPQTHAFYRSTTCIPKYEIFSCKKLSQFNVLVELFPGYIIEFVGLGFVPQKRIIWIVCSNSPKLFSDEILSLQDNEERRQIAGLITSKRPYRHFGFVKNFTVFFLHGRNKL